jgi:octaprenyl-diphosphate synthase
VLAEAGEDAEERLGRYGMQLGIAFQLVDDLLDLTADEETLGKPVASDLREGRLTLPWIDLLACGSEEECHGVLAVLEDGTFDRCSFGSLRAALVRQGCLERTRRLAEEHAERARNIASELPQGPFQRALVDLPDLVLTRSR